MPPVLSICIPTYNRGELLWSALDSLVGQITQLGGKVELVVSDNCSTDDTARIVDQMQAQCPIRYYKNDRNVGAIRNILNLVENLASGEFCWLLGDDELVRDGGVRQIVEALKRNPDLDYFYVNYSIDDFQRRISRSVTANEFSEWTRTGNSNLMERRVERWEELLAEDLNCLTAMYSSVFRRSMWSHAAGGLRLSKPYSSVDEFYPHALIFARTMIGKPAWSSGYPWAIMCGRETWDIYIPAAVLLRFHELLDTYIANGVNPRLLKEHRKRMLIAATDPLQKIFRGEKLPGLESFSIVRFVARFWLYPELWRATYYAALAVPVERVAKVSLLMTMWAVFARICFRLARCWGKLRGRLGFSTRSASC